MKLLIAEDDLTTRTMLSAVAVRWGFEVVEAENGQKAWEIMQGDDAPQLLLVDWEMPVLDGLSLCRRIREQETHNPPYIIMLTIRGQTVDIVEGLDRGANDYVVKPFDNAELRARLHVGKRMLALQEELNKAKDELIFQAHHDVLTGLMNRRAVMKAFEREIARAQREKRTLGVGLCDLDHFKRVNDECGHLVGDEVLKEIGHRLQEGLRPYDTIGRYGGEEFLVVLSGEEKDIIRLFERLRQAVSEMPVVANPLKLDITISCGVALIDPSENCGCDSASMLSAADIALYESKSKGRNCTTVSRVGYLCMGQKVL